MAKTLDLRGERFSRLYALRRVKTDKGARWYCFCSCGGRALVETSGLRSGKVKSCGCLRREAAANARIERKRHLEQGSIVGPQDASDTEDRLEFEDGLADALRGLGLSSE